MQGMGFQGTAGDLEVGKSLLSELGGDRLKEMEKIHAMEAEEVETVNVLSACIHVYMHLV